MKKIGLVLAVLIIPGAGIVLAGYGLKKLWERMK
jgi:hypothetical protein